jgi:hypothetical protein
MYRPSARPASVEHFAVWRAMAGVFDVDRRRQEEEPG